jgi:PAS domain S-box-containing protein
VQSSEDAIVSKDLNGMITSYNGGAERLFGYTSEDVIGKPITILIPESGLQEEADILRRLRSGEHVEHFETVRRRRHGSPVENLGVGSATLRRHCPASVWCRMFRDHSKMPMCSLETKRAKFAKNSSASFFAVLFKSR